MSISAGRQAIYAVVADWRDKCLLDDGSMFSDERIWTLEHARELQRDFVDAPDEGDRSFIDKLRDQLEESSEATKRLAAEMLWLMMLFPSNIGPKRKTELVQTVWEWSGDELPDTAPPFAVFGKGIGSGGTGYNNFRPFELQLLVRFVSTWKALGDAERRQLIADPWTFATWFDRIPGATERQLRHMMLHMLFPGDFDRISSRNDKKRIDRAFGARIPRETLPANEKSSDLVAMDRRIARIRDVLEKERPGEWVDFYEVPWIRQIWNPGDEDDLVDHEAGTVSTLLQKVLSDYADARAHGSFAGHAFFGTMRALEKAITELPALKRRPTLVTKGSIGQGNWARVPWVALMNPVETTTTQRGVYGVLLFREDMSGVYVTFNQGVTEPSRRLGRKRAHEELRAKARQLREANPSLTAAGFQLDDRIDLRASGGLGRDYEVSTIAYKLYASGRVPSDEDINRDLETVLSAYDSYLVKQDGPGEPRSSRSWVFQANPDLFDIEGASRSLSRMSFEVRQHSDRVAVGDRVFLWQSGRKAGVVALATIDGPFEMSTLADSERPFVRNGERFRGTRPQVSLRIDSVLPQPLPRTELLAIPGLRNLSILRGPQGTNFKLTPEEAQTLEQLCATETAIALNPPVLDLRAVVDSFALGLTESNLRFTEEVTRAFVASLATKRFAILTGLSGSGKTQLALRFGQWCGADRYQVIPVRPDWTGPEYMLGYEDALLPTEGSRRAWQAPAALEFILKAASDPGYPYVLVLDEMNLAHVERYFADVLSGMESEEPCVPNLEEEDGYWRVADGDSPRIRFPDNLFIVGTVNVDETTFMFSPKVLDRANIIEFRIQADDLLSRAKPPRPLSAGQDELVRGFLEISRDREFDGLRDPADRDRLEDSFRKLHAILAEGGFEFGHRTFFEALRFGGMLSAAGDTNWQNAADLQVLQKLLPRLHGSRRQLEPILRKLEAFCESEVDKTAQPPVLPKSIVRIQRLLRNVRTNQFAGFIE